MDAFQHWLTSALELTEPTITFEPTDLAKCFTRFHREIFTIQQKHSASHLNQIIWSLYGVGTGYLGEISNLPPCQEIDDFFASVPLLYQNLFEVHCTHFYSHLDRGPQPANPLNGACYMLWDMDNGIDSFWLSKTPSHIQHSIRLLEQLSHSNHPATIESAIHGLGHMNCDFRSTCQPILERILEKNEIPQPLRDYAHRAIYSIIQ